MYGFILHMPIRKKYSAFCFEQFFFLFYDFNLNTQGFVYLEFIKYQLGIHRNMQGFGKMHVKAFFLYQNKLYIFLILGLANTEYWNPHIYPIYFNTPKNIKKVTHHKLQHLRALKKEEIRDKQQQDICIFAIKTNNKELQQGNYIYLEIISPTHHYAIKVGSSYTWFNNHVCRLPHTSFALLSQFASIFRIK